MYDHRKQLKCAIIRARAISDVDNLLPKYATVIDNLCPCTKEEFEKGFNDAFREYAISRARNKSNESAIKKTLDNHRTEVSETDAYRQIGNAIPPVMFWHISNSVKNYLQMVETSGRKKAI